MPDKSRKFMVMVGDEWPLATGYDRYGDPEGYTFETLEIAKVFLKDLMIGTSKAVYELTKVYDSEE